MTAEDRGYGQFFTYRDMFPPPLPPISWVPGHRSGVGEEEDPSERARNDESDQESRNDFRRPCDGAPVALFLGCRRLWRVVVRSRDRRQDWVPVCLQTFEDLETLERFPHFFQKVVAEIRWLGGGREPVIDPHDPSLEGTQS